MLSSTDQDAGGGGATPSVVGVVGVGELGRALVEGLSANASRAPQILLSPRNASHAARLAEQFAHVRVCPDNQAVADQADVVLLAVAPDRWLEAVQPLRLRAGSVLISVMAGVRLADLQQALPPDVTVVRALPMPSVRDRACLTAVFPPDPVAEQLFDALGGTVVLDDEGAFNVLTAVASTVSIHLDYLTTIARWAAGHGIAPVLAEQFVRNLFAGAGRVISGSPTPLAELAAGVETPGGLNERVRTAWFDATSRDRLLATLDTLLRDLP